MSNKAFVKYLVPQLGEQHQITKIDGNIPIWDILQKIDDVLVYNILQSIEIKHLDMLGESKGEQLINTFGEVMEESQKYAAGGTFRHEPNGWLGDICRQYTQTRDLSEVMTRWKMNEYGRQLIDELHQDHEEMMIVAGLNSIGNLVMNGATYELDKIKPEYARDSLIHVAAWQNNAGNHPVCVLDTLERIDKKDISPEIEMFKGYLARRIAKKDR